MSSVKRKINVINVTASEVEKALQPDKQTEQNSSTEGVMYCGPSVLKLGLTRSTVFVNGLPDNVKNEINKCPSLGQLFVPIKSIVEFEQRLSVRGSAEQAFFDEVRKQYK